MSEYLNPNRVKTKADLYRDSRGRYKRFYDFISSKGILLFIGILFVLSLIGGSVGFYALLLALILSIPTYNHKIKYPMFAPQSLETRDYANPGLNGERFTKASGISYLGLDIITKLPVYSNNDVDRQHKFLLMTTGGGKTETILAANIAAGACIQGSGFCFVDGKATVDMLHKTMGILRRFNRDKDLLVINLMKGDIDFRVNNEQIVTNSINPTAQGSYSQISELLKPLLGDDKKGGGDVWKKRAEAYIDGTTLIFCYLRDYHQIEFTVNTYREYLTVQDTIKLYYGILITGERVSLPKDISASLFSFLDTVAGMTEAVMLEVSNDNDEGLTSDILSQYGFISMQVAPMFNILATDYGHVFGQVSAEVDLTDVVLRRRALVVLIPTLSYGDATINTLASIVVSSIRGMLSKQLGGVVAGSPEEEKLKRSYSSDSPFRVDFDEVTSYLIGGMDKIASMGRSIGIAATFGTQELGAMKAKDSVVTSAVWGSTNTKIIGKIEDSDVTLKIINDRLGQVNVTQASDFSVDYSGMIPVNKEPTSIKVQSVPKLNIGDLTSLKNGQSYVIFEDRVIRLKGFYIPDGVYEAEYVELNHFVTVQEPSKNDLSILSKGNLREIFGRVNDILSGRVKIEDVAKGFLLGDKIGKYEKEYGKVRGLANSSNKECGMYALTAMLRQLNSTKPSRVNKAVQPKELDSVEEAFNNLKEQGVNYNVVDYEESGLYEHSNQSELPVINENVFHSSTENNLTSAEMAHNVAFGVSQNTDGAEEQKDLVEMIVKESLEHPVPPVPNLNEKEAVDYFSNFLKAVNQDV